VRDSRLRTYVCMRVVPCLVLIVVYRASSLITSAVRKLRRYPQSLLEGTMRRQMSCKACTTEAT
jgi:hypothetical protein